MTKAQRGYKKAMVVKSKKDLSSVEEIFTFMFIYEWINLLQHNTEITLIGIVILSKPFLEYNSITPLEIETMTSKTTEYWKLK